MSVTVSKKLDAKFRKTKKSCLAKTSSAKVFLSCMEKGLGSEDWERIQFRALSHARKTRK